MLSRRLLAGGGSGFAPIVLPTPSPFALSGADGAVNPWMVPGAYSYGGKTYLGWVDSAGNVQAGTFNETTKAFTAHTIHASFEVDAHTSPAFLRRASDGRIITVYSKHNHVPINIRVSTNADDASAWGAATDLDGQLGGTRYTDEQLWEASGSLYLFYRDEPSAGTDSRWCISKCAPGSPTTGWAAQTIVFRIASTRSYVISILDGTKIHFIATNGASSGYSKLGHFYLDTATDTYHKTDGTSLSLPITFADITTIYSGSAVVFASNVVVSGSEIIVSVQDTIAGAIRYIYVRYNGSSWSSTNVVGAGTGYEYSGVGTGYGAWGYAIDAGNPDIFYVLRDTGASPDLWTYTTGDGGATFTPVQRTFVSSTSQQQVIPVRNRSSALRCLWQVGTWTTYTNYSVNLYGFGD